MPGTTDQTSNLCQTTLQLLQCMDREARHVAYDYPTGLRWYDGYLNPERQSAKSSRSEVSWSKALAGALSALGYQTKTEVRYPRRSRQRCDVVAKDCHGWRAWIELKGAWRHKVDPAGPNKSFLKHLHTAAADISKLSVLGCDHCDATVFVLVGFEKSKEPFRSAEIDLLRSAQVPTAWLELEAVWTDQAWTRWLGEKCLVHCWAWGKTTAKAEEPKRVIKRVKRRGNPRAGWEEAIRRHGPPPIDSEWESLPNPWDESEWRW